MDYFNLTIVLGIMVTVLQYCQVQSAGLNCPTMYITNGIMICSSTTKNVETCKIQCYAGHNYTQAFDTIKCENGEWKPRINIKVFTETACKSNESYSVTAQPSHKADISDKRDGEENQKRQENNEGHLPEVHVDHDSNEKDRDRDENENDRDPENDQNGRDPENPNDRDPKEIPNDRDPLVPDNPDPVIPNDRDPVVPNDPDPVVPNDPDPVVPKNPDPVIPNDRESVIPRDIDVWEILKNRESVKIPKDIDNLPRLPKFDGELNDILNNPDRFGLGNNRDWIRDIPNVPKFEYKPYIPPPNFEMKPIKIPPIEARPFRAPIRFGRFG